MPTLTVVVPIYNSEKTLRRCVDSILHQTMTDWELILVNDGSMDKSGDICEEYARSDARIRVIHQKNRGESAARSAGIEAAHGKYLAAVDSDDWIEPDMYAVLCPKMHDADLVTSGMVFEAPDGSIMRYRHDSMPEGHYTSKSVEFWGNVIFNQKYENTDLVFGMQVNVVNKIYRADIAKKILKCVTFPLRDSADRVFVHSYLFQCKSVRITHKCFYHYCLNNGSVTHKPDMHYLRERDAIYHLMEQEIAGHRWERELRGQLHMLFMWEVYRFTGQRMGIEEELQYPQFRFPQEDKLRGKKVVLFGAGMIGRAYLIKWKRLHLADIMLWVDNTPPNVEMFGLHPALPQNIVGAEYDYIVCAVQGKPAAESIRRQLGAMGIESDRILWSCPIDVWREFFVGRKRGEWDMRMVDYSIQDIVEEVEKGKSVIGFGAGKALDSFCKIFREYHAETIFKAIADNNNFMRNVSLKIGGGGTTVPVRAIDEIVECRDHVDIIIITTQYLTSVWEQLQKMPQLKNTDVVFYGFVIDNYYDWKLQCGDMECSIVTKCNVHIPKIIHYCWFGKNPIPDRYKTWMKSWKKFCPDYEIVEWNESNYDVNKNAYMAEAYEAKKWGFVPDYARLDIIYRYGGIYLDTDVEVIQNLDPMLHQEAFCGFQDLHVALGLGFGSVAYNKSILSMRDDYSDKHFLLGNGKYDLTPSPAYSSAALARHGLILNGQFQELEDISVYPKVFFSPMNHYNRKIRKNNNTFTIHHFDGSWVGSKEKEEWNRYKSIYASLEESSH